MSLWILLCAAWETLRISLPTVIDASLGRLDPQRADRRLQSWSQNLLQQAQIRVVVKGSLPSWLLEAESGNALFLSNHQSLYDIPVLFQALPLRLRMAAKCELFRVPIWGCALLLSGFVRIERKRGAEARAALMEAGHRMKDTGVSLWIAPEGTRSRSGELGAFKTGAFDLARAAELPIFPITIDGTRRVLGKDGSRVKQGETVVVTLHPPLLPEHFPEDRDSLMNQVRSAILSELPPKEGSAA